MIKKKYSPGHSEPASHILTALGVFAGGIVWLVIYASRFDSIEFDGPAGLGLGIGLVAGGVIFGAAGVAYDTKHKARFAKTLALFAVSLTVSSLVAGAAIGSYAKNKWDYDAAHPSECNMTATNLPLACR